MWFTTGRRILDSIRCSCHVYSRIWVTTTIISSQFTHFPFRIEPNLLYPSISINDFSCLLFRLEWLPGRLNAKPPLLSIMTLEGPLSSACRKMGFKYYCAHNFAVSGVRLGWSLAVFCWWGSAAQRRLVRGKRPRTQTGKGCELSAPNSRHNTIPMKTWAR